MIQPKDGMVSEEILNEAIRIGGDSAIRALKYAKANLDLLRAINDAIKLLDCGKPHEARAVLFKAGKKAKP